MHRWLNVVWLGSIACLFAPCPLASSADHLWHRSCDGDCLHRMQRPQVAAFDSAAGPDFRNHTFPENQPATFGTFDNSPQMKIVIRGFDPSMDVVSGAGSFVKREYGSLTFELHWLFATPPEQVGILFDGQPAHPEMLNFLTPWEMADGQWQRSVQWNCPPLGRHQIQFTAVHLNRAPIVSPSLALEIVPPQEPTVIAVGSPESTTQPIRPGQIVDVFEPQLTVRFAMAHAQGMWLHVDGQPPIAGIAVDDCCYTFDVQTQLGVGRHALRFARSVGTSCRLASPLSDPLWIDLQPTQWLSTIRNENAKRRYALAQRAAHVANQSDTESGLIESQLMEILEDLGDTRAEGPSAAARGGNAPSASGRAHVDRSPSDHEPVIAVEESPVAPTAAPSQGAAPASLPPKSSVPPPRSIIDDRPPTTGKTQSLRAVNLTSLSRPRPPESTTESPESEDTSVSVKLSRLEQWLSKMEDELGLAESVWRSGKVVSQVVFDAPAYFPKHGYGPQAQEDARSGLLLLEGMELRTYASGHWELKLPYVRPASPTELRLQIEFKTADGVWKPLTMQPLCFEHGKSCLSDGKCSSTTGDCAQGSNPVRVVRGYSPLLRREVGYFTEVRRRGSATLGHGYDGLEDRRSF